MLNNNENLKVPNQSNNQCESNMQIDAKTNKAISLTFIVPFVIAFIYCIVELLNLFGRMDSFAELVSVSFWMSFFQFIIESFLGYFPVTFIGMMIVPILQQTTCGIFGGLKEHRLFGLSVFTCIYGLAYGVYICMEFQNIVFWHFILIFLTTAYAVFSIRSLTDEIQAIILPRTEIFRA